jgi:hypothetical protein
MVDAKGDVVDGPSSPGMGARSRPCGGRVCARFIVVCVVCIRDPSRDSLINRF